MPEEDQGQEPTPQPEPKAPAAPLPTDPWMDPASARTEIEKLRTEAAKYRTKAKELEPLAAKAKELEDASKTELEKLTEQLAAAKAEASQSTSARQRLELAVEKAPPGVSMEDVRWVAGRAQGATPEELAADVADLFTRLAPSNAPPPPATGQRTPVEQLRPGAMPTGTAPSLADQIAAAEAAKDWKTALVLKSQATQAMREQINQ